MTEHELEACLADECERRGWCCVKHGIGGWPDRIIVTDKGRHVWVELKLENGRRSSLQNDKIRQLRRANVDACFVFGREGVLELFRKLEHGNSKINICVGQEG